MSDFAKITAMELKPDYIARCILENDGKNAEKIIEDKLLHGLKHKDIDFYKKIIRCQFYHYKSAEKAYRNDNDGKMKFNSDHHYYFILARYVLRPIFEEQIIKFIKIYQDLQMFGSKPEPPVVPKECCEKALVKPEPPVVNGPPPMTDTEYKKYMEYLNNKFEMDNKPSIIISNVPKPTQISLYCVV